MAGWLIGAHAVDAVIAVLLAEALLLAVLRRRNASRGLWASLAAGLALMIALRLALTGPPGPAFAVALLAAGAAHALDLRERFRS